MIFYFNAEFIQQFVQSQYNPSNNNFLLPINNPIQQFHNFIFIHHHLSKIQTSGRKNNYTFALRIFNLTTLALNIKLNYKSFFHIKILFRGNMSYFKAILAVIITFHTSSSFGMDSFWQWLNKQEAKTYFEPELQKTLTLIMLKNRGQEPFNQDSDVLKIIAKNSYHLYCDELLQSTIETDFFKDFWGK